MAKRTIKINIKLPNGITATKELTESATQAAKAAIDSAVGDLAEAQKIAKELAEKGIKISAEELLNRKSGSGPKKTATKTSTKKSESKGARKRVVLSDAQRKALIADLKSGAKIKTASEKFGISVATVMNIKTNAGLTKARN